MHTTFMNMRSSFFLLLLRKPLQNLTNCHTGSFVMLRLSSLL